MTLPLIDRGIKFMPTQPNVKAIENRLLDKLNTDKEKDLNVKKDNPKNETSIEVTNKDKEIKRREFMRKQLMNRESACRCWFVFVQYKPCHLVIYSLSYLLRNDCHLSIPHDSKC